MYWLIAFVFIYGCSKNNFYKWRVICFLVCCSGRRKRRKGGREISIFHFCHALVIRCVLIFLKEGMSFSRSVRPSIRPTVGCHWRENSEIGSRADRQNASDFWTLSDWFLIIYRVRWRLLSEYISLKHSTTLLFMNHHFLFCCLSLWPMTLQDLLLSAYLVSWIENRRSALSPQSLLRNQGGEI